jgi:hypothetical protein
MGEAGAAHREMGRIGMVDRRQQPDRGGIDPFLRPRRRGRLGQRAPLRERVMGQIEQGGVAGQSPGNAVLRQQRQPALAVPRPVLQQGQAHLASSQAGRARFR